MKQKMKNLAIVLVALLAAVPAFAFQPPPPNNQVPIDGFLGYLVVAGAFFGYKAIKGKK